MLYLIAAWLLFLYAMYLAHRLWQVRSELWKLVYLLATVAAYCAQWRLLLVYMTPATDAHLLTAELYGVGAVFYGTVAAGVYISLCYKWAVIIAAEKTTH